MRHIRDPFVVITKGRLRGLLHPGEDCDFSTQKDTVSTFILIFRPGFQCGTYGFGYLPFIPENVWDRGAVTCFSGSDARKCRARTSTCNDQPERPPDPPDASHNWV